MWPSNRPSSLVAALAGLAAGACTTVGPTFTRPDAPASTGYAMQGDPAAQAVRLAPELRQAGAWWDILGSNPLDKVIRQSLAGSPTLAEADAVLARDQAEASAVRGGELPRADYAASLERERINVKGLGFQGFPSPTVTLYSLGGTVSYDLDLFGGQRRETERAGARAEAQARRADAAYLTLTGDVAVQAVRIAALRGEIDAVRAIVADDQRLLDMIQAARRAGGAAPAEILGGQAQIARDQALLPALDRDLAQTRHRIALLAGRSPSEWTPPDFDLSDFRLPQDIPVSLPSSLVRNRPDILAAEADLHAATADIGVATAKLYPDIRLSAGLTQGALSPAQMFNYGSSGWNLGAALTGPIFDGGALRAKREAARAEARAALARYQQTVLTAFVQVSDALAALANDDQALQTFGQAQTTAERRLQNARSAYGLGGGALLAVLDAQRQLNDARRNMAQAQGQRYADVVRLMTATAAGGRLTSADNAAGADQTRAANPQPPALAR
jgi:NodT family efflux transporter outer membrane factor (OMF) lipoprotein